MTRHDIDDPDLCVTDLMRLWPETINVFLSYRMLCVGCLVGQFHTVTDARLAYNQGREIFTAALRDAVAAG
mgnify:CR=1 FL=1